jgi:hypothetical protein
MADDDALMDRFERNSRRFSARDAILTIFVCAFLLVLFQGNSMKHSGERLKPGVQRDVVLALGKPAGWIADQLPLHSVAHDLTASLSPDTQLAKEGGFDQAPAPGAANAVPVVTADAFSADMLGVKPPAKRPLTKLLVTGDSLAQPLDADLGRALSGKGVKVTRDAHIGTGISATDIVDWGRLAATQSKDAPDAVVMFIGANDTFPMKDPVTKKDIGCCDVRWATIYANRARGMMNTYRRGGKTHIYWLTIPAQREQGRNAAAKVVNAAVRVAAQPWGSQVTIVDTGAIFSPGEKFRAAMDLNGKQTIVRRSDGIHLNDPGAQYLSDLMVARMATAFTF